MILEFNIEIFTLIYFEINQHHKFVMLFWKPHLYMYCCILVLNVKFYVLEAFKKQVMQFQTFFLSCECELL